MKKNTFREHIEFKKPFFIFRLLGMFFNCVYSELF